MIKEPLLTDQDLADLQAMCEYGISLNECDLAGSVPKLLHDVRLYKARVRELEASPSFQKDLLLTEDDVKFAEDFEASEPNSIARLCHDWRVLYKRVRELEKALEETRR